jgi:hypothetical protein
MLRCWGCLRLHLAPCQSQTSRRPCKLKLELESWPLYVHAHPGSDPIPFCPIGQLIVQLRRITLTAAFSRCAYSTMMDHLGGRLPMDDWTLLEQVCALHAGVSLPCPAQGMARQHHTQAWMLPGMPHSTQCPVTSMPPVDCVRLSSWPGCRNR